MTSHDSRVLPLMPSRTISIRGARTHNLKNVSVDIPQRQLTVVTGPSGSGKSSLAFNTLYAEGQRRFVESMSTYVRQFLERIDRPEDRKSTRLNSSHLVISYAVFCLKK